jgi:hypothetical protein
MNTEPLFRLAVPFGAVCVVVGLNLIARDGQVPNDQQTQSAQLRANQ